MHSSGPRAPLRGEVWDVLLDPTTGHEQGGVRPCLVVSDNQLNQSRAELVVIVPLTTKLRAISSHIMVTPPEGGLTDPSDIMCEHIRSISTDRLRRRRGDLHRATMQRVEAAIRRLLGMALT